jgi:hypothetical protein
MPSAPKHTRRWFQFSLGTMFVVVTVAAVVVGWELKLIRERRSLLQSIVDENRGKVFAPYARFASVKKATIPSWREWLGDKAVGDVTFFDYATDAEVEKARLAFREAFVWREPSAAEIAAQQAYTPGRGRRAASRSAQLNSRP